MPIVHTRHFGVQEYSEDSVVRMPCGIPGFPTVTEFLVLQLPDQYPLVYLQSISSPEICFIALPVLTIDNEYDLQLAEEDDRLLEMGSRPRIGQDALCIALIAADEFGATANLLAPVVINLRTNVGAQCINASAGYSHQHRIYALGEALTA